MQVGNIEYAPNYGAVPANKGALDDVARLAVEGVGTTRIMTGFLAGLTPKQAAEALAYRGPDTVGANDNVPVAKKGFVYLGSPYSLYAGGYDDAARVAAKSAAELMSTGLSVYCPIAHGHFISGHGDLPHSWRFWKAQCQPMIDAAKSLIVLTMDGWQDSVGLSYEIEEFKRTGRAVIYMSSADIQRQAQQVRRRDMEAAS